jgi:type I restriction enzyme, S subunit
MDFNTFLENFDVIAEAPGGIPKLRSLILDLAVRGKLVPQNPEDEPASRMMAQIKFKSSKRSLKLRRGVPEMVVQPDYICDWEIPKNWICASAAELLHSGMVIDIKDGNHGGNHPRKEEFTDKGVPFITAAQVNNFQIDYEGAYKLSGKPLEKIRVGFAEKGDVIYTHKGSIGRVAIAEQDCVLTPQTTYYRVYSDAIFNKYFMWYLCSPQFTTQVDSVKTQTTRDFVPITQQYLFFHLIPPLAEQKRIVEKVDELMGLCDRYEAAKQTRDNLRQKLRESAIASLMNSETDEELDAAWAFVRDNWQNLSQCPEDVNGLREATLQLAIRGKLVSQNINDESVLGLLAQITAEKKHLIKAKKIRDASTLPFEDSAFPCEIPNTWVWERFGNVILDIEAGASPQCESRQKDGDEWGVIKISAVSWNKFNPDENKALPANMEPRKEFEIKTGDFIMSRANTSQLVGKSVVVENLPPRLLLNDKTLRVLFPTCIEKRFFNLYNNSALARQYYAGGGTGTSDSMKNITREQIRNLPVPVPPLHEQKRIVAKVDELMQLCDQLEASLRQSQQRAESLAASAISHLTI